MLFFSVFVVLSAAFATTSPSFLEDRQTGFASAFFLPPHRLSKWGNSPLFPGCALPCLTITSALCAPNDTKCLCQDKDFINKCTVCFQTSCGGDDLTNSIAAALELCRSAVN